MRGDFDEDEDDENRAVAYALALMGSAYQAAAPQGAIAINRHMAGLKAMATRYEDCIRHHSRTCTCGMDAPDSPAAPLISQEVLDGVTVAGARAFWALKDLEKQHESLRAAVMTIYSDPHLTWAEARQALAEALK